MKEDVFTGPDIRKLISDEKFDSMMNGLKHERLGYHSKKWFSSSKDSKYQKLNVLQKINYNKHSWFLCGELKIVSVCQKFHIDYNIVECKIFVASSKSIKAMLLHSGNKYASIPVVHSAYSKNTRNWQMCRTKKERNTKWQKIVSEDLHIILVNK